MGLLRREKYGIANVGFESFLIVVLYLASFAFVALDYKSTRPVTKKL